MDIQWSKIAEARKQQKGKLPRFWKIPFVTDDLPLILDIVKDGHKVLDIGAHDRALEHKLAESGYQVTYKSMDIDRSRDHDYYSLDEVQEKFDLITCLEVIEHIDFESGYKLLERIFELLNPGGQLVISTPNIVHPTIFWIDPTHVTPYNHKDLTGILTSVGFKNIHLFRIASSGDLYRKSLRKIMRRLLCRCLELDFAKRIAVVCRKG